MAEEVVERSLGIRHRDFENRPRRAWYAEEPRPGRRATAGEGQDGANCRLVKAPDQFARFRMHGSSSRRLSGRYWIRTSDFYRVRIAL